MPKWTTKLTQSAAKPMSKTNTFVDSVLPRISCVLASENGGQIDVFSNFQKSTKVRFSVEPVTPKDRFFIQKYDFWHPFWHLFFDFFQKWRKCEISEEYNAKRGSGPSKTFHFRIDFPSNFHVFSRPHFGGHFGRVRAPALAQKCDF